MKNTIENLLNEICLIHKDNDTKKFFAKIQLCLIDCIELLDEELVNSYEKLIITQGKKYWLEEKNCAFEVFETLRLLIGLKRSSEKDISEKRRNALRAVSGALSTYENYEPNEREERTNSLDYCIFYLLNAGVNEEDLMNKLKKHFDMLL